jgi:hypothetical protein
MELGKEHIIPKEVVKTSITFRLCKRLFPRGIKGTFEASSPKELFGLIMYHLDMVYLHKFCLVNKAFYEYLNPLGGCIAVCCDQNDINSDLLDLLYEQFETFLRWYTLKYEEQTTTIFGLILCHDNWPRHIDPKHPEMKLRYVSSPNGNLHSKFHECTNLIGLNLAHYPYVPDQSLKILKRSYNPKLSEYLSMDFILNTCINISIGCEKINYLHMNVSPGYTDSKDHQYDALATDEFIENYFMNEGELPRYVTFGGLIRINHCHNLNEA